MKEKLQQIDQYLAAMVVSGDNVLYVANSRALLKECFDEAKD